jgi:hypothetical protein
MRTELFFLYSTETKWVVTMKYTDRVETMGSNIQHRLSHFIKFKVHPDAIYGKVKAEGIKKGGTE